jgi:hypothetical protein
MAELEWTAVYEYDGTPFIGTLELNDTLRKTEAGEYSYSVTSVNDERYGLTAFTSNDANVIFDQIVITLSIEDERIDVGQEAPITWNAYYEYNGDPFTGDLIFNNAVTQTVTGIYGYTVTEVSDNAYGLKAFESNSVECVFDQVRVTEFTAKSTELIIGEEATVFLKAVYDYDDETFGGESGTIYCNDSPMQWSEENARWEHRVDSTDAATIEYQITKVDDDGYGLTEYQPLDAVYVTWIEPEPEPTFLTLRNMVIIGSVIIVGLLGYHLFTKRI